MDWLNYHHLVYFWTVVREGGVSKAAARLRLSQPTVSAQVKMLEDALGERLFERQGRGLVPTEAGRLVYRYADEIVGLGREMVETVKGRPSGRAPRLTVGLAQGVAKMVAYRLLSPAVGAAEPVNVTVVEDTTDALVARLASHEVDVVISDTPAPPHLRVKVFNHLLGESGTTFFASAPLAARLRKGFPRSLSGAPMLLPTSATAVRRALDQWFDAEGLTPLVRGEFDDAALMKMFGEAGREAFPSPTALERDICRRYRVAVVGRLPKVRERYFAISAERRVKHPGVLAITAAAREDVFVA